MLMEKPGTFSVNLVTKLISFKTGNSIANVVMKKDGLESVILELYS